MAEKSWLTYTSKEYDDFVEKWKYIADHLDGSVIDDAKIEDYLHKRKQGESDDAYTERKKIVDYTPNFHRAALTLAGMLWAVEYDARRTWAKEEGGDGMGSPKEDDTIMSRLWLDADGKGTNWNTLWHGATIDAISYTHFYVLVDGVRRDEEGNTISGPSVRIIPPQSVPRTVHDDTGRMISAKVKTRVEVVRSQQEKASQEDRYLIFNLNGVQTWRHDDKGNPEMVSSTTYGGPGNPEFRYKARDRRTDALPIFEVRLPLRGNLGYIMAKKSNALLNQASSCDFQMWTSGFPKLFADVKGSDGSFDDKQWNTLVESLAKGMSVLPGAGNKFDAAPTESLTAKRKILQDKTTEFFTTFFQSYGDAASERTATEIRQDFRAGVEAFLTLLSSTMDEAENAALWRLEQVEFPGRPEIWGGAFVERSTDFQPVDIEARIYGLIQRYMPQGKVPVDLETALEIAVKALESDGVSVNQQRKNDLREKMRFVFEREQQQQDLLSEFGVAA